MNNKQQIIDRVKQILEEFNSKMTQIQHDLNVEIEKVVKEEIVKIEAEQKSKENPEAMLEENLKSL